MADVGDRPLVLVRRAVSAVDPTSSGAVVAMPATVTSPQPSGLVVGQGGRTTAGAAKPGAAAVVESGTDSDCFVESPPQKRERPASGLGAKHQAPRPKPRAP